MSMGMEKPISSGAIIYTGTVAVWLMNGLTITSVGFPGSTSTDWQIAGVGDVNGDGKADLVWRNTSGGEVVIWLMDGATIASSGYLGGVSLAWEIAGTGDVNGDGKADLIWRNSLTGTVAVWLMNGLSYHFQWAFPLVPPRIGRLRGWVMSMETGRPTWSGATRVEGKS